MSRASNRPSQPRTIASHVSGDVVDLQRSRRYSNAVSKVSDQPSGKAPKPLTLLDGRCSRQWHTSTWSRGNTTMLQKGRSLWKKHACRASCCRQHEIQHLPGMYSIEAALTWYEYEYSYGCRPSTVTSPQAQISGALGYGHQSQGPKRPSKLRKLIMHAHAESKPFDQAFWLSPWLLDFHSSPAFGYSTL